MNQKSNNYKEQWVEALNKNYNPLKSWTIKFHSEEDIKKDNFKIETIRKNQIEEYFNKQADVIWLIDKNGKKIPAVNQTEAEREKKTLKAVFSGHQLKILSLKNENNTYFIEVGVKNLLFSIKDFF